MKFRVSLCNYFFSRFNLLRAAIFNFFHRCLGLLPSSLSLMIKKLVYNLIFMPHKLPFKVIRYFVDCLPARLSLIIKKVVHNLIFRPYKLSFKAIRYFVDCLLARFKSSLLLPSRCTRFLSATVTNLLVYFKYLTVFLKDQFYYAWLFTSYTDSCKKNTTQQNVCCDLPPVVLIIANSTGNSEPRLLRECSLARQSGLIPFVLCLPAQQVISSSNNLFHRIDVSLAHNNSPIDTTFLWDWIHIAFNHLHSNNFVRKIFPLKKVRLFLVLLRFLGTKLYLDYVCSADHLSWLSNNYNVKCVISHDYYTYLPGILASNHLNAPLVYDIHEHALSQYDNPSFKRDIVPYLYDLHHYCFQHAHTLGIVSPGILNELVISFPFIESKARLLRNMPSLNIQNDSLSNSSMPAFDGLDSCTSILYSGLITTGRGLENLLLSVPFLDHRYHVYLMGPMCSDSPDVLSVLDQFPESKHRVHILDPVPFSQLISTCSSFDIGYLVQPLYGPQKQFSLANKFFEYIHSDMMLCTDSSWEMSSVVRKYKIGCVVNDYSPLCVAETLNSFSDEEIASFQASSRTNKSLFTFESDSQWLTDIFNSKHNL